MLYSLLLDAIPLPDGEKPASNYTLKTKLNVKVLDFVQLGGPTWMVGSTVFEMWLGSL